jgi:hypothetical protein
LQTHLLGTGHLPHGHQLYALIVIVVVPASTTAATRIESLLEYIP